MVRAKLAVRVPWTAARRVLRDNIVWCEGVGEVGGGRREGKKGWRRREAGGESDDVGELARAEGT